MSQFPYPRKSSDPATTYSSSYTSAKATSYSARDRKGLKSIATYIAGGLAIIWFLFWFLRRGDTDSYRPPGTPNVVIVTTIDPRLSQSFRNDIMANRNEYARRHGYATFFPNTTDYDLMPNQPRTWSTIPALRHAMALHPHTPWFWYLSHGAVIMDARESLETKFLTSDKISKLMITNKPVVPPDSVIKTYAHLKGHNIDMIVSQDHDGLAGGSLFLRSGDWAKYFLDAWFDPLYRNYNFQKAEAHALEHIVQWHGTVLAKLALVPQKLMNSYIKVNGPNEAVYEEGDFVANSHGCARDPQRNCEEELEPILSRWRETRV